MGSAKRYVVFKVTGYLSYPRETMDKISTNGTEVTESSRMKVLSFMFQGMWITSVNIPKQDFNRRAGKRELNLVNASRG